MGLCVSTNTKQLNNSLHDKNDIGKVSSAIEPSHGEILQSPKLEIFCLDELKKATSNFSQNAVIGKGGFGSVYKGWIEEHSLKAASPETGTAIAVAMLNPNGSQGQQECLTEIKYLGQLYHPNLVKLIGYCFENDYRLLVYEFMPNGSLEDHIFIRAGESHIQALSWDRRMKVALGAAEALAFLHNKVYAIHRDIKISSILLDANYNAKLSGFGLARDGPTGSKSYVSTRAVDTEYAAPEYIRTGHLSKKCDVYSFGIVLLEMISGRRVMERNRQPEEQNLGTWARNLRGRKDMFSQILNPAISGHHATTNVIKVAQLALKCVLVEPKLRPDIEEVVGVLIEVQDFHGSERSRGSKHYRLSNSSKYQETRQMKFGFEFHPRRPSTSLVSI
ncbi:probable serine/threonine-protein kinase PBL10 isoform X2 [Mercurialis annua]|uniref:probable serine/threonine-protein kinase PBL10 isoform X2 n=1 Tax=Mercurialis annua TaxID=3986 RepID=UPI0024AFD7BF|nr:probable serine/threonine-protein kinase PBL10 isoform X2 [Mercurialis annua]